jgi:PTH2 family peptidyl-tRNA hydrolase
MLMKQVIAVRTDLDMGKGKIATQVAHASMAAFTKVTKETAEEWLRSGMKKVVVKVKGEKELLEIYRLAKKQKLPCELVSDAGRTQVEPGTTTAVGIGPADEKKIDEITGKLKLL